MSGLSELGGGETPAGVTPADRPAGRGRGGKRPGAGRPPDSVRYASGPRGDASYARNLIGGALDHARDLLGATMRDEGKSVELRVACALALIVGGKAAGCRRKRDPKSGGIIGPAGSGAGPAGGDPIAPGGAGDVGHLGQIAP
jgi:hypothetical protein